MIVSTPIGRLVLVRRRSRRDSRPGRSECTSPIASARAVNTRDRGQDEQTDLQQFQKMSAATEQRYYRAQRQARHHRLRPHAAAALDNPDSFGHKLFQALWRLDFVAMAPAA